MGRGPRRPYSAAYSGCHFFLARKRGTGLFLSSRGAGGGRGEASPPDSGSTQPVLVSLITEFRLRPESSTRCAKCPLSRRLSSGPRAPQPGPCPAWGWLCGPTAGSCFGRTEGSTAASSPGSRLPRRGNTRRESGLARDFGKLCADGGAAPWLWVGHAPCQGCCLGPSPRGAPTRSPAVFPVPAHPGRSSLLRTPAPRRRPVSPRGPRPPCGSSSLPGRADTQAPGPSSQVGRAVLPPRLQGGSTPLPPAPRGPGSRLVTHGASPRCACLCPSRRDAGRWIRAHLLQGGPVFTRQRLRT